VTGSNGIDDSTITGGGEADGGGPNPCIGLRVLFHPDPTRVDDVAALFDLGERATASIHRNAPTFRAQDGRETRALQSAHVSRHSIRIVHLGDDTLLDAGEATLYLGQARLTGEARLTRAALLRGVALGLGDHVVLWLGPIAPGNDAEQHDLIGSSEMMRRVRRDITQVADLDVSVLLRGESGVGKELVAAALHRRSKRAVGPYVTVNMAAIPPSTAVSELFGHARGAFTGASGKRAGCFEQAHGGTLFLDEIGHAPNDVQPMLLRAIESGEVQGLGARTRVDVRVLAATDSNLEQSVALGHFHSPLLRRFEYSILIPPLRERKEDLGGLFLHFLRRELSRIGEPGRLATPVADRQPWLPAGLGRALASYDWPGNVRELRNVVTSYVVYNRGQDRVEADSRLWQAVGVRRHDEPEPEFEPNRDVEASRSPGELSDDEIAKAWRESGYRREEAAQRLGVGTTWLFERLQSCRGVRLAKDIPAEELRDAYAGAGGDLELAAGNLGVSSRALVLQIRRLNLTL
jgi:two-component system nitrogen regulation response regulator GlnG